MTAHRTADPHDQRHDDQYEQSCTNHVGRMHLRSLALTIAVQRIDQGKAKRSDPDHARPTDERQPFRLRNG